MTNPRALLPLVAQCAYFAAMLLAILWFVFFRTTWIGKSANGGTFGLSSNVAPMWDPPKPFSGAIPSNVVRTPFWPRWKDSVVPDWSMVLLKLTVVVILINLSFGAAARRVWNPGANYWFDFAWYSGLCQIVAAFALTLVSLPLYLILDDLLGVFTSIVLFGGALAGHRFARLDGQRQTANAVVEQRGHLEESTRQEVYSDDEAGQERSVASPKESESRGRPNYSTAIGGVAMGLVLSLGLMLWSVLLGKLCYDQGLLPHHNQFLHLRITGVVLVIGGVCCAMALLLRKRTDQVQGVLLGMIAGCLFWSVLMFSIH